ncbi:MAG TPA: DUF3857 domain-containing protein, partial [Acidobacteria bacterium]|nr:DUF3857 domain-containing protein [Acidobacteriota bacterium]
MLAADLRRWSACLAILVAGLLATPLRASGDAPACIETWWRGQLEILRANRDSALAMFPLRLLGEMAATTTDPSEVTAALEALREDPEVHPLIAAEIDYRLVSRDLQRGAIDAARQRLARLGVVQQYLLVGSLEEGAERDEFWPARHDPRRLSGRRIPVGPLGVLRLRPLLHPNEHRVAAVAFFIHSERRRKLALRFGSDDRAEVWLDGKRIFSEEGTHAMAFDQQATVLDLSPGWHQVGLFVEQVEGAWRLIARLTETDGRPLDGGVEFGVPQSLPERLAPASSNSERRRRRRRDKSPLVTLTMELEALARSTPRYTADLALDLARRELPDRDHARAEAMARENALRRPLDPHALWAAALVVSDRAEQRGYYERMLAIDPSDPAVLRRLAQYHLVYEQIRPAVSYARRSLEACSQPDPYLEGWLEVARYVRGFPQGASAVLARLSRRAPHQASVLERLASLYSREQLVTHAIDTYQRYLALERLDGAARSEVIRLLEGAGRDAEAQRLLEEAIRLEPLAIPWRLRLAEHQLVEGRADRALETVLAARKLAPDSPSLLQVEGEIRLALDDRQGAARAWRQVIELSGEASGLAERLASLEGRREEGFERWTVSLDAAREMIDDIPAEQTASVVALSHTEAFEVKANGMATRFTQTISLVRDPQAASFARGHSITYSPRLQTVRILDAKLVRKDGSVVPAARRERPLLPDPELRMWYDSRVLELSFPRLEAGDLIDVRYTISDIGHANPIADGYFGDIVAVGTMVPVLSTRVILEAPTSLPLRYHFVNLPEAEKVTTTEEGELRTTRIELSALPAYPDAPLTPPVTHRVPYAIVSSIADWNELGRLYARLLRPQMRTTSELQRIVREVTAGAGSPRRKIFELYRWVIENTRYVALEFGIHAIKPYDVAAVLDRHYGDCKDKANLLAVMLREAGIEAYVALLRSRPRGHIDTTIPVFSIFDHAIVYVPSESLWLDGTVLTHGPQELPMADRDALA